MDLSDQEKSDVGKRNEESLRYQSVGVLNRWQCSGANFSNSSMGQVPNVNQMAVCGDVVDPTSSSSTMVESFGPTIWGHPISTALPLGFNGLNVHAGASISDSLAMLKGSQFSPNMLEMLPPNLSQFPTDSGFIERAARFSSFGTGHFADSLNPFGVHQPINTYLQGGTIMDSPQEVLAGHGITPGHCRQPQKTLGNIVKHSKDIPLPPEVGSLERILSACKTAVDKYRDTSISKDESEEEEFSGRGSQEDEGPSPIKGLSSKKRKKINHDAKPDQDNEVHQQSGNASNINTEAQENDKKSRTLRGDKSNGKHGEEVSQASDPPKGEYVHVRARRGQATNSHSLAERVRRERISERMKYLQDLVPGCSKVTGKAVMLDEIINYVQSLQRQVEFLSMKLAAVNSRLDLNIEQLLAKNNMFAGLAGPSKGQGSSMGMRTAYPPMHQTQWPILQSGLPGIGHSSEALKRTVSAQLANMGGGYQEPTGKMPHKGGGELHNIVQMGVPACASLERGPNCPS